MYIDDLYLHKKGYTFSAGSGSTSIDSISSGLRLQYEDDYLPSIESSAILSFLDKDSVDKIFYTITNGGSASTLNSWGATATILNSFWQVIGKKVVDFRLRISLNTPSSGSAVGGTTYKIRIIPPAPLVINSSSKSTSNVAANISFERTSRGGGGPIEYYVSSSPPYMNYMDVGSDVTNEGIIIDLKFNDFAPWSLVDLYGLILNVNGMAFIESF
jgi:hypothetical protein